MWVLEAPGRLKTRYKDKMGGKVTPTCWRRAQRILPEQSAGPTVVSTEDLLVRGSTSRNRSYRFSWMVTAKAKTEMNWEDEAL